MDHSKTTSSSSVHPRACGEHLTVDLIAKTGGGSSPRMRGTQPPLGLTEQEAGSSPRMRGTHPCPAVKPGAPRFIPAHAGNTIKRPSPSAAPAVHPRACGEHASGSLRKKLMRGSSPRMRGTRCPGRGFHRCCRFIPAHAGNTKTGLTIRTAVPVHPRACGEHGLLENRRGQKLGSSPRMRGTRF